MEKQKEKLTELAKQLLEKEVIFKDDLVSILGERPFITPEKIPVNSKKPNIKK